MGDDFAYNSAFMNFKSMDKFITYFNSKNPGIHLFYSTPGEYMNAIRAQQLTWPVKYDDMFPYADHPDEYWTGYFSSRANSKIFVRNGQ